MILDLMVTNAKEPIGNVKTGGNLGCSDHTMVDFIVLRDMEKAKRKVRALNFRKANFQFFKELVSRIPCEIALRDKGAEQSWQIFKYAFHRAQELLIPRCKKPVKEGKRPAWLSLVRLKGKKNAVFTDSLSSHTSQVDGTAQQGLGEKSPSHCKRR